MVGPNRKLKKLLVNDEPTANKLTMDFEEFTSLNQVVFPFSSLITLDVKNKENKQVTTVISIKYSKVELLDTPLEFPFRVPVKLLNSKKKVYFEGATMGHCVYTNYWERIKKLKYVVFHVTLNGEEATLGCGLHSNPYQNITGLYGTIYPEQVYTRFNKATTREMKEFCFDFINNNKYMFKEFLINKQSALETIQCELEPVLETIQCELEPVLELELPYAYDPALEFAF
jgi:hypothetical protein